MTCMAEIKSRDVGWRRCPNEACCTRHLEEQGKHVVAEVCGLHKSSRKFRLTPGLALPVVPEDAPDPDLLAAVRASATQRRA